MKPRLTGALLALAAAGVARGAPPSTAWREQTLPGEEAILSQIPALVRTVQEYNTRFFGAEVKRTFHPLPLAGFEALLRVDEDLPPEAAHGVFVPGAEYRALARFSRGLGVFRSDKVPDIWGMAVKLFDVPGEVLLPDPTHGRVQDLTALNAETFPAPNAAQVPKILEAAADYAKFLWRGPTALRLRDLPRAAVVFGKLLLRRVDSLATETYFSGVPIQVGPYAAKFRFRPEATGSTPREGKQWFARDLEDRLATGPLRWVLELQFYTDDEHTPLEEAMKVWESPWRRVATLELLPSEDPAETTRRVDLEYFHPWQGVAAHRPLGSVMRARRVAYSASQMNRGRPLADPRVLELEAEAAAEAR